MMQRAYIQENLFLKTLYVRAEFIYARGIYIRRQYGIKQLIILEKVSCLNLAAVIFIQIAKVGSNMRKDNI